MVFLDIEALVFNLPAQPPGLADQMSAGPVDGDIAEMDKPRAALLAGFLLGDRFDTFNPIESMRVIVNCVEPAQLLNDL